MLLAVLFAAAGACPPSSVLAQEPGPSDADRRLAQSLFDQGRELMSKGDFANACPLLAESQRLDPGGGTLINLAVCNEQAGKLATAHAQFHEALSQAIRDGRKDRQQIAEERIAAILPKLSRIAIEVPATSDVPGLVLTLDGVSVPRAAWGTPTAVDGGEHRIEASAPGRIPWSTALQIAREGALERVRIPALAERPAPSGALSGRSAAPCPDGTYAGPSGCMVNERTGPPTWIGVTALTAGGLAIGVGLVSGFVALIQASSLGIECDEKNRCPRSLRDDVDSYEAFGTTSTITLVGGTALVGAGIVLLLLGDSKPAPAGGARGGLELSPLGVRARF